jgi:hypothetical protein
VLLAVLYQVMAFYTLHKAVHLLSQEGFNLRVHREAVALNNTVHGQKHVLQSSAFTVRRAHTRRTQPIAAGWASLGSNTLTTVVTGERPSVEHDMVVSLERPAVHKCAHYTKTSIEASLITWVSPGLIATPTKYTNR